MSYSDQGNRLKSKVIQIIGGFLLGVLPYALFFIVLAPSVPGGRIAAPGFATALAMVPTMLGVGILVLPMFCQSLISLHLFKKGYDLAAKAVWLIYPLAIAGFFGRLVYWSAVPSSVH